MTLNDPTENTDTVGTAETPPSSEQTDDSTHDLTAQSLDEWEPDHSRLMGGLLWADLSAVLPQPDRSGRRRTGPMTHLFH